MRMNSNVVGSLVYCAAFWPLSENEAISKLGFDDSKVLKEGERERSA
jgi:ribonuclease HII